MNSMPLKPLVRAILALMVLVFTLGSARAEFLVGAARTDITPPLPVALSGQFHTRIAKKVESPVLAAVVAIESRSEGKSIDQAVMVTCDLVAIREGILDQLRQSLTGRDLPGLDVRKVFLSATHTHTAPVMRVDAYQIPEDGVTQPAEFVDFLVERLTEAIETAWTNRKPGAVSWGLGHAVVANNRRAVYENGSAAMYGSTSAAGFRGIEGYEDHGVETLFFWGADQQLLAMAVNVACPAQEVEGGSAVNADYWHEVRVALRERHGDGLVVLGWCGAAGDQSPHLMFRKAAEERMLKASGRTRLQEIARRIVRAVDEAYEVAQHDLRDDPKLSHEVTDLILPRRLATEAEVDQAKIDIAKLQAEAEKTGRDVKRKVGWHQKTIDRFEQQTPDSGYPEEVHTLRLGDIAICTNSFELFTEYGIRLKARCPAEQTFVIQLAGPGSYLATRAAEAGGGYSAIVNSCQVGPEGGDLLVDETLKSLGAMWKDE